MDEIVSAEQRQAPRKIIRAKAMLLVEGGSPLAARTIDIGVGGMAISVAEPVKAAQKGQVSFEIFFDGKSHIVTANVLVSHCIFSSDGFKVGLQFGKLELSAMTAITKYMR